MNKVESVAANPVSNGSRQVHDDSPLWSGDFTLDYNFEASFWGLYANNRLAQAEPQHAPVLAYAHKARRQAMFYNCSGGVPCRGLHYPGHIAPFGFDSTLAGEPWASMSDHSNAVFAALNMIAQWEYGRNDTFLRTVAFPFCRDALLFYQGWMRRRPDGSWVNENDQVRGAGWLDRACVLGSGCVRRRVRRNSGSSGSSGSSGGDLTTTSRRTLVLTRLSRMRANVSVCLCGLAAPPLREPTRPMSATQRRRSPRPASASSATKTTPSSATGSSGGSLPRSGRWPSGSANTLTRSGPRSR